MSKTLFDAIIAAVEIYIVKAKTARLFFYALYEIAKMLD